METLTLFAKRTPSIIWDAIIAFFRPLKGFPIDLERVRSEENYLSDELYVPLRYIRVIQDSACYNQGAFTQYWYLASQKHKRIRLELDGLKNRDKLTALSADLINFLNYEFHRAALENFNFIHDYFGSRDSLEPRICIKGYFHTDDRDTVITVFRDREVDYEPSTPMGTNTGFDYVHQKGKYYLCNDLYSAAIEGKYSNPRLDHNSIDKAKKTPFLTLRKKWSSFWKDSPTLGGETDYYRSTLIIPMTFWNNSLNKEFLEALEILPNKKRTIFGFLCIDHAKANYFKQEADVSVGYYFADALSQYLFSRLVYTTISTTQEKLEEYLKEHPVSVDEEKLERLVEVLARVAYRPKSVREINESSEDENYTYMIDESLRQYINKVREITQSNKALHPTAKPRRGFAVG